MKKVSEVMAESIFLEILDEDHMGAIKIIKSDGMLKNTIKCGDRMSLHAGAHVLLPKRLN